MNARVRALIDRLCTGGSLSEEEFAELIEARDEESAALLAERATAVRRAIYGDAVYTRGLIEISNICKNDCLYCGLRRGNAALERYRLAPEEILACAEEGHRLGFRTFVLQGGEDGYYTDEVLCGVVSELKARFPDSAVTLSMGERGRESYRRLFEAGTDRYLLRHETADAAHYARLHPPEMSFENRMRCLRDLRDIGYQVGCGFMVGSPHQTFDTLLADLQFIRSFRPHMVGIGPFIPAHDTPFAGEPKGSVQYTLRLLAIIRLLLPDVLLPATTALGTLHPQGRELGIQYGANVVMPNLSPRDHRKDYSIYDNKICTGEESAECRACTEQRIRRIGYETVVDRGDHKEVIG